jgi:opacity protein-like surface antigen
MIFTCARMGYLWVCTLVLFISISVSVPCAYPEAYIAGQFGMALPSMGKGLSDIDITTQFLPGTTHSDLALKSSALIGLKAGYYFKRARWFGLEAEAYNTTPHIKEQTHSFQNPAVPGVASGTFQGAHFRVFTLAPVNLMFRYPKYRLQPYVGIGPALFFARIRGEGLTPGAPASTSDNARLGVNAKAGVEYYITRHLTAFGEVKYNYARFNFRENADLFPFPYGFESTYRMYLVSFGIGYHF